MESKLLPNNLSVEELLRLVDAAEDFPLPKHTTDVSDFLSVFRFEKGDNEIYGKHLYTLYSLWSKKPVPDSKFALEIRKYAPKRKEYYLLNCKPSDIDNKLKELDQTSYKPETVPSYKNHFESFIRFYGLKKNDRQWVEGYTLYLLYHNWTRTNKFRFPWGFRRFVLFCNMYFPIKENLIKGTQWFGVDKSVLSHLTEEELLKLRKAFEKNREKRQKNNKKRGRKVSGSRKASKSKN